MTAGSKKHITELLVAWSGGDQEALDRLMPLVYDELHRQAARFLSRERSGHTLQPTALVNEVYLRLVDQSQVKWQNRAQFFGIAAQMMRRILVSNARARHAEKRGGREQCLTLNEEVAIFPQRDINLLALDDALTKLEAIDPEKSKMVELKLEAIDPEKSKMVELRFFSGLSIEETAEVLTVSPRTVDRQWQTAKAWLYREIVGGERL